MKNKSHIIFIVFILAIIIAVAFIFAPGTRKAESPTEPENIIIGGQTDEHGCLGSAGYSWCDKKEACIRLWEEYCTDAEPKTVTFLCEEGKTITATFYVSDDKFVDLDFGDDRRISLPRAISASGARYAKADESLVFWNKGDTAFVTEDGEETHTNCVIQ